MSKFFRATVKGMFVELVDKPDRELGSYGFYTTFFVNCDRPSSVQKRLHALLEQRMMLENVRPRSEIGGGEPYFCFDEIWEISRTDFEKHCESQGGFTFFKLGFLASVGARFEFNYRKKFKKWSFV